MLQGVSQFRQPVIYGNDKVLLCLRIRHVICIYRVCHGKVGVDALNGQLIQFEQGQQSLGKQDDLVRAHGDLAALRAEHIAVHADDIADIHLFEFLISFLADLVSGHIGLDIPL